MSFFADIQEPITFAGTAAAPNDLAFRVYDPDRIVLGKRMEEHLRIGVCYWHSFNWPGSDIFGQGTFDRPWLDPARDPMDAARQKQDAAFEFFTKLGTPFARGSRRCLVASQPAGVARVGARERARTTPAAPDMRSKRGPGALPTATADR